METNDLTIEILRSIRDEIRQTNERVDVLTGRVDQMGESLGRRITESEMRTATALLDLAKSVNAVTDLLKSQQDLRPRVETCEREISLLKAKLSHG